DNETLSGSLADRVIARPQSWETVVAAGIRRRCSVDGAIAAPIQLNHDAADANFTCIAEAVAVHIVEYVASGRDQAEVAKVTTGAVVAADALEARRCGRGLRPSGLLDFRDRVIARPNVRERVIAERVSHQAQYSASAGVG